MSSAVQPLPDTVERPRPHGLGPSGSGPVGRGPVGRGSIGSHHELVALQQEQFGGMKFGCSFFGWLTATGTAVLLTGLLAAAGSALGLASRLTPATADSNALRTAGLVGGVTLLVVILLSYVCGGYVAARMARFNGLKQGLGVWLWALIVAVVLAVLGFVAGGSPDLLRAANGIPAVRVNASTLTSSALIAVVSLALTSLVGALLGGLAGTRYHRRVDRAGFEDR